MALQRKDFGDDAARMKPLAVALELISTIVFLTLVGIVTFVIKLAQFFGLRTRSYWGDDG